MGAFVYPLIREFRNQFGSTPFELPDEANARLEFTDLGSQLVTTYLGRDIWLPIRFTELNPALFTNGELLLPFATIRIGMKKTFIRTPLSQREGTVKELFSIDDYEIAIRGFLIDIQGRSFPEQLLVEMRDLFKDNSSLVIDNAITNVFLPEDDDSFRRVIIESFDLPEVEGGRRHVRPFAMKIESDVVFTLEDE